MDLPESKPKYWAFISYSRHDRRVASRVAKELAMARVPAIHRDTVAGNSSTFSPIYLDQDEEAAGAALSERLQTALTSAHALIVVCSPFAVASGYVSAEIRYFQSLGRAQNILCIVASGTPNASDAGHPELECFPKPLRCRTDDHGTEITVEGADRPLAALLNDESKSDWQRALEQLQAGLIKVSRSELRALRTRRLLRHLLGTGSCLLALIGLFAFLTWAYVWPRHSYAEGFARRWGSWEPVRPLSREQASARAASWRFERAGALGRLLRAIRVNPQGNCAIGYADEIPAIASITGAQFETGCTAIVACGARFRYDEQGKVAAETIVDQYDNALETVSYTRPGIAILTDAVIGCGRVGSAIDFIEIERLRYGAQAGFDRRYTFRGGRDKTVLPNIFGAYGLEFTYDENGALVETLRLDALGRGHEGTDGTAMIRRLHDDAAGTSEVRFLDRHGAPITGNRTASVETTKLDEVRFRIAGFDAEHHPAPDSGGVFAWEQRRNAQGQLLETRHLDGNGRSTVDQFGVAAYRYRHDEHGYVAQVSTVGSDGAPVAVPALRHEDGDEDSDGGSGCESLHFEFSSKGEMLAERCFDAEGNPATTRAGWHSMRNVFTARGEIAQQSFWTVEGKPAGSRDLSGSRFPNSIHRAEHIWDDNGRLIRMRFFDADDKPTINADGVAGNDLRYDASGRAILIVSIGLNGRPSPSPADGCPADRYVYNDLGQQVSWFCSEIDGTIRNSRWGGVAERRTEFDAVGRVRRRSYFDANGKPTLFEGAAAALSEYDRYGNLAELRYLDISGALVDSSYGIAIRRHRYDAFGRRTGTDLLDSRQKLALLETECSALRTDYDIAGRIILERCVGNGDEPVNFPNRPLHAVRWTRDARGNAVEERYLDRKGRPTRNEIGVAGFSSDYDSRNRIVRTTARDLEWHPATTTEHWATREFDYGPADLSVEERYLDTQNRLLEKGWAAISRQNYDALGRAVLVRFFDADGDAYPHPGSGRAQVTRTYDAFGRLTAESSLDVAGEPVDRTDLGWHRKEIAYDVDDNQTAACFNVRREPVNCTR